jgi:glycosyltransferase involved in cell wall biosynthesis
MMMPGLIAPILDSQTLRRYAAEVESAEAVPAVEPVPPPPPPDPEILRKVAWDIGAERARETFVPTDSHVGLGMVGPKEGFAHWRMKPEWMQGIARERGNLWNQSRPILRLYDVSYIEFNGFNAHRVQDHTLPGLDGHLLFSLPRPGTYQLAEVGFLLRNGEFIPAARSAAVAFAPDTGSGRHDSTALIVDDSGVEEVGNVWDQQEILRERRRPRVRSRLRVATLALGSAATGAQGPAAQFVAELARGIAADGHEVHVVIPAREGCQRRRTIDGVIYQPLDVDLQGSAPEQAFAFAQAALKKLKGLPKFDLYHFHDWMASLSAWITERPSILSLTSIESVRRNGGPANELSTAIEQAEREAASAAGCVLTPGWLHGRAIQELGLKPASVTAFPMEGRLPSEWECDLDQGQVKKEINLGPLDRLVLYIGPLEHAAGPDLLVEALPTALNRWSNLRIAFVGMGSMHGHLEGRANHLGVGHAVRLLGHMESSPLSRLLRAASAVILPSRGRVPFDDSVVELTRRAGRPIVTTHAGPAHLIKHEQNGLLTYDNPGSMVWAIDRVCSDPGHAERMGQQGRRTDAGSVSWPEVARAYLELCATRFPELTRGR